LQKVITKHIITILLIITLTATLPATQAALATSVGGQNITSKGAIIIDFDSGLEIFEHNADNHMNPASMTKMMTVYLVYEAIAAGTFDFDTRVPISSSAAEFSRNTNETNVPLTTTGNYTVSQLLDAVIVVSAGGATYALAEFVGGSRAAFMELMNDKASQWGIDAHYTSVSGGPRETYVTPRAMATLTRKSIQDYPEILEKTAIQSLRFSGWDYPSTNKLLGVYDGIDGFKTGTNNLAGECFASTAKRGDTRLITVTMGSSYDKRFSDTRAMLDYGFAFMEEYLQNNTPPPPTDTPPIDPPDDTPDPNTPTDPPDDTPDPNNSPPPPTGPNNSPPPGNSQNGNSSDDGLSRPVFVLLITGSYALVCTLGYIIYRHKRKAKINGEVDIRKSRRKR